MTDDNLPKIHPREFIVDAARKEISCAILDARLKHKLTYAESFEILTEYMRCLAERCVRVERDGTER